MRSIIIIPSSAKLEIYENQRGEVTVVKTKLEGEDEISLTTDEACKVAKALQEVAASVDAKRLEDN